MARFKQALWDNSDPNYAPGLTPSKDWFYWVASKKFAALGYEPKREKLEGTKGDGRDLERAARCRALTRQMIRHFAGEDEPKIEVGTWAWIIHRYQTDKESPYQNVKANTRELYDILLRHWTGAIGNARIANANYQAAIRWQNAMKEAGRSQDWIKRMFTMLRTVNSYGALIEHAECVRFKEVLSGMRIKAPKTKPTEGTADQVLAIIEEADCRGLSMFALGCLMQWWWALRAVDVRGQWLEVKSGEEAAIVRNGQRWADGMTWDMIDPDVTRLTKMISKTADTTGKVKSFNLEQVPEIRERLLAVSKDQRVGPIIINPSTGLPYTRSGWANAWQRCRKAAGVPSHVKNMGTRSAAGTHGAQAGADPFGLRDALGHGNVAMTDRYIRGHDENTARVIDLRRGKKA